jgi:MAC/Perforin domain
MPEVQFRRTDPIALAGARGAVGLPGTDSIGMGYDVFSGRYASPKATTRRLFDLGPGEDFELSGGTYVKPKAVSVQTLEETGIVSTEGRTSRDYQADRAVEAGLKGGYGFFTGSLDAQFTRNERNCTTYTFISQTDRFHKYLLSLAHYGNLIDAVLPDVRADLDAMPPAQLFSKFGTHFLQSLIIGATSVYSSATNTAEYTSKVSAKRALELQYKVLTGNITGTLSAEDKDAVTQIGSSSHLEIFVQGGKAELAHAILDGTYQPWIDSIEENMAFVGLVPNSLQPIWQLCAGQRCNELAAAYGDFARAYPAENTPDIVRIHHFSTNVQKSRHYYSQHVDAFPDKDWQRADSSFKFYAFSEPGEDRIPIYVHESANPPRRFNLSPDQVIGHGWRDSSTIAFYAFKERGEGRVAVFGFTADAGRDSPYHGWLYTTDDSVKGWLRQGAAFFAPPVK